MGKPKDITYYEPKEERLNIISHGIGLVFSILGLVLLLFKSKDYNLAHFMSFFIFGASMILVYLASTLYHSAKIDKWRHRLNVFDHASIYVLIAGTQTPFAVVTIGGKLGWYILILLWVFGLVGVVLKLFYTGRYQLFSTIMYVVMGWLFVIGIKPLLQNLAMEGMLWILFASVSYMVGAVFFSLDKIKYNHAIFHLFVLIGSFGHFMSIYFYVVPLK